MSYRSPPNTTSRFTALPEANEITALLGRVVTAPTTTGTRSTAGLAKLSPASGTASPTVPAELAKPANGMASATANPYPTMAAVQSLSTFLGRSVNWTGRPRPKPTPQPTSLTAQRVTHDAAGEVLSEDLLAEIERPALRLTGGLKLSDFWTTVNWRNTGLAAVPRGKVAAAASPTGATSKVGRGEAFSVNALLDEMAWD